MVPGQRQPGLICDVLHDPDMATLVRILHGSKVERTGDIMPGKLPIDRVRAALKAPRIFERMKRRFSVKQARLSRQQASGQDSPDFAPTIAPDGHNNAHEHGARDPPRTTGTGGRDRGA